MPHGINLYERKDINGGDKMLAFIRKMIWQQSGEFRVSFDKEHGIVSWVDAEGLKAFRDIETWIDEDKLDEAQEFVDNLRRVYGEHVELVGYQAMIDRMNFFENTSTPIVEARIYGVNKVELFDDIEDACIWVEESLNGKGMWQETKGDVTEYIVNGVARASTTYRKLWTGFPDDEDA